MGDNVWETYTDAFGVVPMGAAVRIGSYWAPADDPTLGVCTTWGLKHLIVVFIVAALAQAVSRRRWFGIMLGFLWAYVVSSYLDVFADVVNVIVYLSNGSPVDYVRIWAPQWLAYNTKMNLMGALFGTLFAFIVGSNPFMHVGEKYSNAKASYKALLYTDWIITWILTPLVVGVVEWFAFWGLFTTKLSTHAFRLDVMILMFITIALVIVIYGLYLLLTGYSTELVMKFWGVGTTVPRSKAPTTTAASSSELPEIEDKDAGLVMVRIRHIISGGMMLIVVAVTFIFQLGKILPNKMGYTFQPLMGVAIGVIVVALVRVLMNVWPANAVKVVTKAGSKTKKLKMEEDRALYSAILPTTGFRSSAKPTAH